MFAVPGNQVATAIWINSVVKIGTQFPVSHTLPYSSGAGGSFQVVGGVVTQAHFTTGFRGGNPATVFTFDFGTPGPTFNHQSFNNGARQTGTNMVVGNINTVPEPSAFSLFAISLIGLGCVARRKGKNRA